MSVRQENVEKGSGTDAQLLCINIKLLTPVDPRRFTQSGASASYMPPLILYSFNRIFFLHKMKTEFDPQDLNTNDRASDITSMQRNFP